MYYLVYSQRMYDIFGNSLMCNRRRAERNFRTCRFSLFLQLFAHRAGLHSPRPVSCPAARPPSQRPNATLLEKNGAGTGWMEGVQSGYRFLTCFQPESVRRQLARPPQHQPTQHDHHQREPARHLRKPLQGSVALLVTGPQLNLLRRGCSSCKERLQRAEA